MGVGIFARTFPRSTLEANLDVVAAHGCECTQYNLLCAGLPSLPDAMSTAVCERIRVAHCERSLRMAAVSGTFNIIDPDRARRAANMTRFAVLAEAATALGTHVITVCTGTRDAEDLWRVHPENATPAAWLETLESLRRLVDAAERSGVVIAFEPEPSNVIASAHRARAALDRVGSARLKIVFDAANLLHGAPVADRDAILGEALQLLGKSVAIVHIKPLDDPLAAGDLAGQFSYLPSLLRGLNECRCQAPLILHGVAEPLVAPALAHLRRRIAEAAPSSGVPAG